MTTPATDAIAKAEQGNSQGGQKASQGQQRKQEQGEDRKKSKGAAQVSAQDAARQAQQRYGGRVLKVDRQGAGYNVRLLQDDGRVINVSVGG